MLYVVILSVWYIIGCIVVAEIDMRTEGSLTEWLDSCPNGYLQVSTAFCLILTWPVVVWMYLKNYKKD